MNIVIHIFNIYTIISSIVLDELQKHRIHRNMKWGVNQYLIDYKFNTILLKIWKLLEKLFFQQNTL